MDTSHYHPMLVHFPIALLITGFLFDVTSVIFSKEKCLSKSGFYLMILGTLGCIAAYFSGEYYTDEMTGAAGILKEEHEFFSKITMYGMIILSTARIWLIILKKKEIIWKWIILLLYLAGIILVGYTGFLGGKLVYNIMTVC